jgi:hypothetical protein
MGGVCGRHDEKKNTYTVLMGKPKGKSLLKKYRRRVKDYIKWIVTLSLRPYYM